MRALAVAVLLAATAVAAQAQTGPYVRAEIGGNVSGDRDRGYKASSVALTGRCVIKLSTIAIDASAEWVFHAPKIAPSPGGTTFTTNLLIRRYLGPGMYVVAGLDANTLSSFVVDSTAVSAATGAGLEVGRLRLQGIYEPPDLSSGQNLTHYRIEAEYIKPLKNGYYVSVRQSGVIVRLDRDGKPGTLTAERFGLTIAIGRTFSR